MGMSGNEWQEKLSVTFECGWGVDGAGLEVLGGGGMKVGVWLPGGVDLRGRASVEGVESYA